MELSPERIEDLKDAAAEVYLQLRELSSGPKEGLAVLSVAMGMVLVDLNMESVGPVADAVGRSASKVHDSLRAELVRAGDL